MTADLLAFLRAQLDDDERVAQAAITDYDGEASWTIESPDPAEPWPRPRLFWLAVANSTDPETMPPGMAEHIARWDPARVLAEVAAKRRILTRHERCGNGVGYCDDGGHGWELEDGTHVCGDKLDLAQPYAGRPGWREEWRA